MTDIEIARSIKLRDINEVAADLGLTQNDYECYGRYKAKVVADNFKDARRYGKVILVTAMSPTKYGEGKTTVSIGLADGINKYLKARNSRKNVCLALREPSLGPVFGIKGGATGGGRAQVAPMEDINLHFTGDFHAIENANNLLCAMVDNHIYQGNELGIAKVEIKRCMDMNDRQLRYIVDGLGDKNGITREDGFDITVASEVMACFCLAMDLNDLKRRLGNITVGYAKGGDRVYAWQLHAEGAMIALLKDAFNPNLVQTLEGTPALIHGGPFANIAHGCNSIVATDLARALSNYVVTEAGFGADLGAEKFMDIKCRQLRIAPSAIVLVVTCRAVEHTGFENVLRHYENLKNYGSHVIVAINKFSCDSEEQIVELQNQLKTNGIENYITEGWEKGGDGVRHLAAAVIAACDEKPYSDCHFLYKTTSSTLEKLKALARYYGTENLTLLPKAVKKLEEMDQYLAPICVAKTQYSFSDNPELLGAPTNFSFTIRDLKYCSGAEFIVAYAGDIMTMPGLPKVPAAEKIDVDEQGNIQGIF